VELNWSTFVLEIINFIILVWILKHFFYKPVLDIIARRKSGIEETLSEAKHLHSEADSLRTQYENRISEWEKEKQQAWDELKNEIETERNKCLDALHDSMALEREKQKVIDQQRLQIIIDKAEETALVNSAQFASKLLQSVAGPELENRLVDLFINELKTLSNSKISLLRTDLDEKQYTAEISSAYPLSDTQRQQIETILNDVTQSTLVFKYKQDSELLAGVFICIGARTLGANLRDELKTFEEFARDS